MADRTNRAGRVGAVCAILLATSACAAVAPGMPPSAMRSQAQAIPLTRGSYYVVKRGDTLWRIARAYGLHPQMLASANRMASSTPLQVSQKLFIPLPPESQQFYWPMRGTVGNVSSKAIRIGASPGNVVRASRTGRVAVAASHLSGWGKTVILDHLDGYLSVYAGMDQLYVMPGAMVPQGSPLGSIGEGALHFEIRQGTKPKNTLALLPPE